MVSQAGRFGEAVTCGAGKDNFNRVFEAAIIADGDKNGSDVSCCS